MKKLTQTPAAAVSYRLDRRRGKRLDRQRGKIPVGDILLIGLICIPLVLFGLVFSDISFGWLSEQFAIIATSVED